MSALAPTSIYPDLNAAVNNPPVTEIPITHDVQPNLNYLQPNNFLLVMGHAPDFPMWLQKINLPGVAGHDPVSEATPFRTIFQPGKGVQFNRLRLTFAVDEDLVQFMFFYNWIMQIHLGSNLYDLSTYLLKNDEKNLLQNANVIGGSTEMTIFMLTNKKNVNVKVTFGMAYPISIGDIELETTATNAERRVCAMDVIFNHIKFEIIDPNYDPVLQYPAVKEFLEIERRKMVGQPIVTPDEADLGQVTQFTVTP